MPHLDQNARYLITIEGAIDSTLVDWSGPVAIANTVADEERAITTLSGIVTDQAGLIGLIRHLHGLGITLLGIQRVDA